MFIISRYDLSDERLTEMNAEIEQRVTAASAAAASAAAA